MPILPDILKGCPYLSGFISPEVDTVLRISFFYLARISEILNLRRSSALSLDRVVVSGLKQSRDYLIHVPGLGSFLAGLSRVVGDFKIFNVSYQQCYKQCLKAGLVWQRSGSKHNLVTHAARHLFGREVSIIFGKPTASSLLHHKSRVTVNRYQKEVKHV